MPSPGQPFPHVNNLLASLPPAERKRITQGCELAELAFGETLCEPGDAMRHVYFPTNSYISLIAPVGVTESIEVGLVGNEGMFGITLLLDVKSSPLRGLVQGGGPALRMTARRFARAARESNPFRRMLNRYLFFLTSQLSQTAACNRFHQLDARMARWLLMSQDRAHSATYRMTHKFLAYMLGVRRAGVTEAAGRLQAKGLIHYVRGEMTVLDRRGLEEICCPCYHALATTYRQYVPQPRIRAG